MKRFISIMVKDYEKEGFTSREWIIGGVMSFGIVAAGILAEVINQL